MFKKYMLVLSVTSILCVAITVWFAGRAQFWAHHVSDPACLNLKTEFGPGNKCQAEQTAAERRARMALGASGLCFAVMALSLAGIWVQKRRKMS